MVVEVILKGGKSFVVKCDEDDYLDSLESWMVTKSGVVSLGSLCVLTSEVAGFMEQE